jgi:hypothetical protein
VVRPEGVEPPTYWFVASCSIQLSYGRTLRGTQLSKSTGIRRAEQTSAEPRKASGENEWCVRKDWNLRPFWSKPKRFVCFQLHICSRLFSMSNDMGARRNQSNWLALTSRQTIAPVRAAKIRTCLGDPFRWPRSSLGEQAGRNVGVLVGAPTRAARSTQANSVKRTWARGRPSGRRTCGGTVLPTLAGGYGAGATRVQSSSNTFPARTVQV